MSHMLPHDLDTNHDVPMDTAQAHPASSFPAADAEAPASVQQPQISSDPTPSRKKRKADPQDVALDTSGGSAEQRRRLRRSHEACARCRSKKIKCDSKHPKCSACVTAGTPCEQEDRHRQMLTPRGHTERLERLVAQLVGLVRHYDPTFNMQNIEDITSTMGIQVPLNVSIQLPPTPEDVKPFPTASPTSFGTAAPPNMYGHGQVPISYGPSGPYGPHPPPPGHMPIPPPPGYTPQIHPSFQQPQQPPAQGALLPASRPSPPSLEVKGQDPQSDDMSSTQALAKNFGVSPAIMNTLPGGTVNDRNADREDLSVGLFGLSSGRDKHGDFAPLNPEMWVQVHLRHTAGTAPPTTTNTVPLMTVHLPKDRQTLHRVVDAYFVHLNIHRPVFRRAEFEQGLEDMYSGHNVTYDPGYLCSLYLILALGTLSELNGQIEVDGHESKASSPTIRKLRQLTPKWPEPEDFFDQAVFIKPDLRVTISSLQALILLHWYLYTERQGRTLWRLVGNLVRLSIELGLHHDPTTQMYHPDPNKPEIRRKTFTDEECELRIRLWAIVMIHDRGTSILLGRPLAIAPHDSNTPHPPRHPPPSGPKGGKGHDVLFSEHFTLSHPVADIQADIINSLYGPNGTKRQSGDTIVRHATRIVKSMVEFRNQLPESYKWFFQGTEDWEVERKSKLVESITEDQGLTMLKLGIARILLLRALFNSKELPYAQRHRALLDAIVTSHNIIIVHNQLIRFPNIGFFVSPIPIHLAAMVICYGHMSNCDRLPISTALQDVWLALDMIPRFRWRWERKDINGEHPLIARLAEKVFNVSLVNLGPPKYPALIPEQEWDSDSPGTMSPASNHSHPPQSTPTMSHAQYSSGSHYPSSGPSSSGGGGGGGVSHPATGGGGGHHHPNNSGSSKSKHGHHGHGKDLAEVPPGLFYPFYPEDPATQVGEARFGPSSGGQNHNGTGGGGGGQGSPQDPNTYNTIFAALAGANPEGYGSQNSYMLEEKDPSMVAPQMPVHWPGMHQSHSDGRYSHMQPPPQ